MPPLPLSEEAKEILREMKKSDSSQKFPIRFVDFSVLMNSVMTLKEQKKLSENSIYDIRSLEEFEKGNFTSSIHLDITSATETSSDSSTSQKLSYFCKQSSFKHTFIIGDTDTFQCPSFISFLTSLKTSSLQCCGLYLHLYSPSITNDLNLITSDPNYYPCLILKTNQMEGVFLATPSVSSQALQLLGITIIVTVGVGKETVAKTDFGIMKGVKRDIIQGNQADDVQDICDKVSKKIKTAIDAGKSMCIVTGDVDNMGLLVCYYYLMTVRGYSYVQAEEYIFKQKFTDKLTQSNKNFLKYLFVKKEDRPPTPKEETEEQEEEKEEEPEFKIEDTFQMKLRTKKFQKSLPKPQKPTPTPSESPISSLIKPLLSKSKTAGSLPLIDKIVMNIINNPEDVKYRSLKVSNTKLKTNIFNHKVAVNLLEYYGFIKDINEQGEHIYTFPITNGVTALKGKRLDVQKVENEYRTYNILK